MSRPARHWTHRIPLLGPVAVVRPRWSLAVLVGLAVGLLLRHEPTPLRLIAGWDAAALLFLVTTIHMALSETPEQVRRRARLMDAGARTVLLLTLVGAAACLLGIITGVADLKAFAGGRQLGAALIAVTVTLTWMVTQCSFALHYAHRYYGDRDGDPDQHAGGLSFPGNQPPDYLDFAYFSFVLGMTFQVSDVQIEDRSLRRLGLLHGVLSFFFTTVILALTINVLAGLAQ